MTDLTRTVTRDEVAAMIDHTLLAPEATVAQIETLCEQGIEFGAASVCVTASMVPFAVAAVGDRIPVAAVIGFPSGAHPIGVKRVEIENVLSHGAREIDAVVNLGPIKSGLSSTVAEELAALRRGVPSTHVLKLIMETGALTDDEIVRVAELAVDAGIDFLKTSTGFHPSGGATVGAVRMLRAAVGPTGHVKASGGVRTKAAVLDMIEAGADRIGTSSTAKILAEFD